MHLRNALSVLSIATTKLIHSSYTVYWIDPPFSLLPFCVFLLHYSNSMYATVVRCNNKLPLHQTVKGEFIVLFCNFYLLVKTIYQVVLRDEFPHVSCALNWVCGKRYTKLPECPKTPTGKKLVHLCRRQLHGLSLQK